MNKFAKYNTQIESCGEDLTKLDRFVEAQRVAFYKLLKKYMVWNIAYIINNIRLILTLIEMDWISNAKRTIRVGDIGRPKELHTTRLQFATFSIQ